MALIDLWKTSRSQLEDKNVQQVITFAGDGRLVDNGSASLEFRAFLQEVPTELLGHYAVECLATAFPNSGLALQDVVNEVGSRLGFKIVRGRYRGVSNQNGFDGLWQYPNGHSVVVEVKTTDAYRIDLNKIAGYRHDLIVDAKAKENATSILIVVGRQDTGDLEAQIRGSRHAWDVRLISVDALLRLLALKEQVEDPTTIKRIHELLIPREFTRLDEIAEILFSTAEDIKQEEPVEEEEETGDRTKIRKPKFRPVAFHDACATRIQAHLGQNLTKRSRATFTSPDGTLAVVCAVSKRHADGGYWFAFHPYQKELLEGSTQGFVALGCGSSDKVLLIPIREFSPWLSGMGTTEVERGYYWHVLIHGGKDKLVLYRRKGEPRIDLTPYLLPADVEKPKATA